ncbi:MAG: glutamate-1-semialdehyde 2,1-aminomutase [Acidimicrobiales bacterium]
MSDPDFLDAGANEQWFARARQVIPGGVDSPVRSFAAVGGTPYTVARGEGAHVSDVEGRVYVDMVQSYGAVLLGHAHPAVTDAVCRAAARGTTFGAPTEGEVLLAETICARVEGCDQVRFVSSGTEAAMSAVRVARGYTGRDRVVVFEGCYHGHSDTLLAGGGSGVATLGLPLSAGVPSLAVAETMVVPYGEVPDIDERVACVLVEPVAANMGVVPPPPGFLQGLRQACDDSGALLVFDEVITGFRVLDGAASDLYGVRPDLWCFGKVIGGGLPIGAFGGRREVLSVLAPEGPVYQAGTLSGNPVATAAGLAVLSEIDGALLGGLSARVASFAASLASVFEAGGVEAQVPYVGPLVGVFFAADPVRNFADARRSVAGGLYPAFFRAMLDNGVALAPGPYEALFPGAAHSAAVLDRVLDAAGAAVEVLRSVQGAR